MRTRLLGIALVAAAIGTAPALAQNTPASTPPANPAPSASTSATMSAPAPAATPAKGPSGSLQKYNNEWRTSQLVGATVYSSDGDSLGTVSDLLTGDNGQIDQVVISTGGVLGIGSRMVEVPLNQLKFEPSAENNAAPPAAATSNRPAGNGGPIGGGAASTSAAAPPASHPTYYSIVLPNATKDTLAKMQEFKFASTS